MKIIRAAFIVEISKEQRKMSTVNLTSSKNTVRDKGGVLRNSELYERNDFM